MRAASRASELGVLEVVMEWDVLIHHQDAINVTKYAKAPPRLARLTLLAAELSKFIKNRVTIEVGG
jgi:hypothetical protein